MILGDPPRFDVACHQDLRLLDAEDRAAIIPEHQGISPILLLDASLFNRTHPGSADMVVA